MKAMQMVERIEDDPKVREARGRFADLRHRLEDAQGRAARPFGVEARESREQREAREEAMRLQEEAASVSRAAAEVEAAARERIVAARRSERVELLRRLLAAAEAALAAAAEVRQHDEETAARVGLAPGAHPLAAALALRDGIERLRQELAGPRPEPAPALPSVRPGETRVKYLKVVLDHHNMRVQYPGEIGVLPVKVAEDLVKRGLAVLVGGA